MLTHLEVWAISVREPQNTNVNHVLFMRLFLEEDGLEAGYCGARLRDDVGKDLDVDSGRVKHILIRDQLREPRLDLNEIEMSLRSLMT